MAFETNEYMLKDIFDIAKVNRFIIPSFQRSYAWEWEQCEKLWNNIYDKYENKEDKSVYFLGTIITYKDDHKDDQTSNGSVPEVNIIDGQQRITTLLLLFRAIHHVLSNKIENIDDETIKFNLRSTLNAVASTFCQRETNEYGNDSPNFDTPRLICESSRDDNIIKDIIANGKIIVTDDNESETNYVDGEHLNEFIKLKKELNERRRGRRRTLPDELNYYLNSNEYTNYAFFIDKIKSLDMHINTFTRFLLERCILLNIMTPSKDYAFTVFDTLNNSGLQLAPSDIVKNYIFELAYDRDPNRDRTQKTSELWDEFESICKQDSNDKTPDLDLVFRNYMNIARVNSGQYGKGWALSKDPNIRDYFSSSVQNINTFPNGYESLKDEQLMNTLIELASFLTAAVNPGIESYDNELINELINGLISLEARQGIHIIQELSASNKLRYTYLLSIFWYKHRDDAKINRQRFANDFAKYIKFCLSYLALTAVMNFVDSDSITIGDGTIPRLCELFMERAHNEQGDNKHLILSDSQIDEYISESKAVLSNEEINNKLSFLPLMYSYVAYPDQPIINNATIEHILPKKWENLHNSNIYKEQFKAIQSERDIDSIDTCIEMLGNKMIMDKAVNSGASNSILREKIKRYMKRQDKLTDENKAFVDAHSHANGGQDNEIWSLGDILDRNEKMLNDIFDYIRAGISEGMSVMRHCR